MIQCSAHLITDNGTHRCHNQAAVLVTETRNNYGTPLSPKYLCVSCFESYKDYYVPKFGVEYTTEQV